MAYNILGINPFHNGSVCVLSNGEIVYFLEEERLSKYKQDANPFRVILDVLNKYTIDEIVIAGINNNNIKLPFTSEDPFYSLIRKHLPGIPTYIDYSDQHHQMHLMTAFYNSGFDKAIGIILDAGGSYEEEGNQLDSIYTISKIPSKIKNIYKFRINPIPNKPSPMNIGAVYSYITYLLGFSLGEEGKTMGLSSYGEFNPSIPSFFDLNENYSNTEIIFEQIQNQKGKRIACISKEAQKIIDPLLKPITFNDFRKKTKFTQIEKDFAWYIQRTTETFIKKLITKSIERTNIKNIVCSGGVFLNCVANYYLTKEFPDINFYFEPISSDAGTAIGATYNRWKELNPEFKGKKQSSIYYGPQYSKEQLLEGIKKYV